LLAALGLGFFALDEFLQFHETWGRSVKLAFGRSGTFRNWNDVIVIGYGVVGLILGIIFFREILRYPRLAEMLIFAFLFYCIHTIIDSTQQPRTLVSVIFEETAKLYSSSFLAISMSVGLLGVVALGNSSRRK
jgi:hypothetical protein